MDPILPILSMLGYWAIILGSFGGPGITYVFTYIHKEKYMNHRYVHVSICRYHHFLHYMYVRICMYIYICIYMYIYIYIYVCVFLCRPISLCLSNVYIQGTWTSEVFKILAFCYL